MRYSLPISRALLVALLGWSTAACQSTDKLVAAQRQTLGQAVASVEQGRMDDARDSLHGLLASTRTQPEAFALQRFHAHALLTQIELSAGIQATNEIQAVEHLVAVHWHDARARHALALLRAQVANTPARELLPLSLASRNTQDVVTGADLASLASAVRLGVGSAAEMKLELARADVDQVDSLLEASGIPGPARVWIYLDAFERLSAANDPSALAFGVAALDAHEGNLPASRREQIGRWLTSGQLGLLACPDDGELFDPQVPVCTTCGRMRREFRRVKQHSSIP